MEWIRVDVGAPANKKVRRLARLLGCSRLEALGRFVHFLCYVGLQHEDGDLSRCDLEDLEEALGIDGDGSRPEDLVADLKKIGILEGEPGRLVVAGWDERNGYMLRERERKRRAREERRKAREKAAKADPEPGAGRPRTGRGRGAGRARYLPTDQPTNLPTPDASACDDDGVPLVPIASAQEVGEEIRRGLVLRNRQIVETWGRVARRKWPDDPKLRALCDAAKQQLGAAL